jgi:phosphoglycerate dehydrogenase-like enzyme
MSALRRIPDDVHGMRGGMVWKNNASYGTAGILDRDIGIVGFGMISRYLIEMLKPFRAKIKIYSGYPIDKAYLEECGAEQVSLEEAFSCSVVSLHSALSDRTRGMVGRELLNLIPEGGVFINTSRGAIVRENELIEVLKERNIFALLDVFEVEPPSLTSPLRSLPNVYPIPHRAGPTNDRRPYIGKKVAEDIIRFKNGENMLCEISSEYAKRMTKH